MSDENSAVEIPEERRFVWRNLDAFLAGELSPEDHKRVEAFLCDCPYTNDYVQTEQQFAEAVRRCVQEKTSSCPEGLQDKVRAALANCVAEEDEGLPPVVAATPPGANLSFPWLGTVFMAAASIMLVVALVMFLGEPDQPVTPTLPESLAPMVAQVGLDSPKQERCRYGMARDEYRRYFADGPNLPHVLDNEELTVSHYACEEVDGQRVMCAVYDTKDGHRFGLMIFKCDCIDGAAPKSMKSVEVLVDGKVVLLWRDGDFVRALVGDDSAALHRHMGEMRGIV